MQVALHGYTTGWLKPHIAGNSPIHSCNWCTCCYDSSIQKSGSQWNEVADVWTSHFDVSEGIDREADYAAKSYYYYIHDFTNCTTYKPFAAVSLKMSQFKFVLLTCILCAFVHLYIQCTHCVHLYNKQLQMTQRTCNTVIYDLIH